MHRISHRWLCWAGVRQIVPMPRLNAARAMTQTTATTTTSNGRSEGIARRKVWRVQREGGDGCGVGGEEARSQNSHGWHGCVYLYAMPMRCGVVWGCGRMRHAERHARKSRLSAAAGPIGTAVSTREPPRRAVSNRVRFARRAGPYGSALVVGNWILETTVKSRRCRPAL
jgi:hypothetical protein